MNYWAKRLDVVKHIINDNDTQIGGGVYCGKFGALLGNNYANENMEICTDCKRIKEEQDDTGHKESDQNMH